MYPMCLNVERGMYLQRSWLQMYDELGTRMELTWTRWATIRINIWWFSVVLNGFTWSGDEVQFLVHIFSCFWKFIFYHFSKRLFDISFLSISRISRLFLEFGQFESRLIKFLALQVTQTISHPPSARPDHHLGPIKFQKNYVFLFISPVARFLWTI